MSGLGLAARVVDGKLTVAAVVPQTKASLRLAARVVGGKLVLAAVAPEEKVGKPKFAEGDHPRDRHGRFIEVGGTVSIFGGGTAEVIGSVGGGRIEVQKSDGSHVVLDAGQTTQIRSAKQNEGRSDPASADPRPGTDAATADAPPPNLVTPGGPDTPDVPTGSTPAADADPAGAFQQLRSADGQTAAWLRTDEGDTPVGYLRTTTDDPSTTVRFGDAQTWAEEVDTRGLEPTEEVPPAPDPNAAAPAAAAPGAPAPSPTAPNAPAPAAAEDKAPVLAPSRALRSGETASPQQVALFLEEGLSDGPTEAAPLDDPAAGLPDGTGLLEDDAAASRAKQQVVSDLTERMKLIPDEVMISPEALAELSALEDGSQVRLRKPDAPDRQIDVEQWNKLRTANRDELTGAGVEVVSADQYRHEQRENTVSHGVALWATTSNGDNARALAMQEVAADLFGMEGHADWDAFSDNPSLREQVDQWKADDGEFMQAFLLAQYEATQDRLAEAGITEVEVFRGTRVYDDTPEWALADVTTDLPLRPLSSFTSDPEVAGRFARTTDTDEAYIVSGVVPAGRVISTPRSGSGSLSEAEFVVLSGPGEWNVRPADESDGPLMNVSFDPFGEDLADEEYVDEPFDPATEPAVFLTGDELTQAIAVADTPERRQELVQRAAVLRMNDVIPPSWNGDGSADDPGTGVEADLPPLTDEEYSAHTAAVEDAIGRANAAGLSSERTSSLDGNGQVWDPERRALHREIVNDVLASGAQVPTEGRALLVGGPIGAPRLVEAKADRSKYLTINAEDIKALLAAKGAVPDVPDAGDVVAPMERTPLVDEEATYLANVIGQRAAAERRNVAFELGMDDPGSVERRLTDLRNSGYTVDGEFVDVPVEVSERRATAVHRAATDAFRNGQGDGGRYVPPSVIREKADETWGTTHRATFEKMRDEFADWTVYDGSADAGPPRRVYGKGDPDLDQRTEAERVRWKKSTEEKALPGTASLLASLRAVPSGRKGAKA